MCALVLLLLPAALLIGSASAQSTPASLRCADLSALDDLERAGAEYRDEAGADDALRLLQRRGLNTVRLRLWHTPADGRDGLPDVLALAKRVQALGLELFLDLHYSDTWADPAQQTPPAAWASLALPALIDSVRAYSARVVGALDAQGTPPAAVQIGNEITGGMLWPHGRVGGAFDTPEQWAQLRLLLHAAAEGVRSGAASPPAVALHLDRGGDLDGATWFFDRALADGLPVDVLALSYYPWWHGDLADLERTLGGVAERYQRPVLVAETAYPWTLGWFDDEPNIVGLPEQLLADLPATPDGQVRFVARVAEIVSDVSDGLGAGVCYWAPEYVSAPALASPWENLALFDNGGYVLPAATLGGSSVLVDDPPEAAEPSAMQVYPNPASREVRIVPGSCTRLDVFDVVGRRLLSQPCRPGTTLDVRAWPSGMYTLLTFGTTGRPLGRVRFSVAR